MSETLDSKGVKVMIKKLTTVEVNGTWYLCELHEGEKRIELRNACKWNTDDSDENVIREWIMKQNLGELRTIIIGKAQGYAVDPLDAEQKQILGRLWEDMQEIKKIAIRRLENSYFTKDGEG